MLKRVIMGRLAGLIYIMTLKGASEKELDRVIKYSRDFIDYINGRKDEYDVTESYNSNNILELSDKYSRFLEDEHAQKETD